MAKQFIIHLHSDLVNAKLYSYEGSEFQHKTTVKLGELADSVSSNSDVILFLPSSLLLMKSMDKINSESDEVFRAKFFAENEDSIINNISSNYLAFSEAISLSLVVDRNIIEPINKALNQLGCSISVFPEHFLNHRYAGDSCLLNEGRFIFAFADGTGFSCSPDSLTDYLALLSKEKKNYKPVCLNIDKEASPQELHNLGEHQSIKLDTLHLEFLQQQSSDYPSLFKFQFSLTGLLRRLSLSRLETVISIVLITGLLTLPFINLKLMQLYEQQYKQATLEIFQTINPNTRRVINPKIQMNQILQSTQSEDKMRINPSYLGMLQKLNLADIKKSTINFETGEVEVFFREISALKYSLFKRVIDQIEITLVEDNLITDDGSVSGSVTMRFENNE